MTPSLTSGGAVAAVCKQHCVALSGGHQVVINRYVPLHQTQGQIDESIQAEEEQAEDDPHSLLDNSPHPLRISCTNQLLGWCGERKEGDGLEL